MKSNFLITNNIASFKNYLIARIDGEKAYTLRGFYEEMAKALNFPDYFGYNLDALDEFLNDLSWLDDEKILIYISKSEHFVEKERNPEKFETLIDMLDATCDDWKWEDEGNDGDVPKKELVIAFSSSDRIKQLLDNQGVNYEVLA